MAVFRPFLYLFLVEWMNEWMNESFISVHCSVGYYSCYSFVNEMIFLLYIAVLFIFIFLFFILFLILLISSCSWPYFFNISLFLLEFVHFKWTWVHRLLGHYSPILRIWRVERILNNRERRKVKGKEAYSMIFGLFVNGKFVA